MNVLLRRKMRLQRIIGR